MRRIALLIFAVLACMAQAGDSGPRARASICVDKQCERTSNAGFEPATVRVSFFVPTHVQNRAVAFGLLCTDYEAESAWELDGANERIPSWLVRYERVPAGVCLAQIAVVRSDGKRLEAKSERIVIQGRD